MSKTVAVILLSLVVSILFRLRLYVQNRFRRNWGGHRSRWWRLLWKRGARLHLCLRSPPFSGDDTPRWCEQHPRDSIDATFRKDGRPTLYFA